MSNLSYQTIKQLIVERVDEINTGILQNIFAQFHDQGEGDYTYRDCDLFHFTYDLKVFSSMVVGEWVKVRLGGVAMVPVDPANPNLTMDLDIVTSTTFLSGMTHILNESGEVDKISEYLATSFARREGPLWTVKYEQLNPKLYKIHFGNTLWARLREGVS